MANSKKSTSKKTQYASPEATMFVPDATVVDPKTLPIGDLFKQLGGYVKAHPYASIGTGVNAAGNVAGLFDNDKLLGQAIGTGLGAAAPMLLSKIPGTVGAVAAGLGGLGKANLAMLGGNLGALFDNLRAKREQEQAALQQYYGG